MNSWNALLDLDVARERASGLLDVFADRRVESIVAFANRLVQPWDADLAARVLKLAETAPDVLRSAEAWVWMQTTMLALVGSSDHDPAAAFDRFELAGAIATAGDWEGVLGGTAAGRAVTSLPGLDSLLKHDEGARVAVRGGVLDGPDLTPLLRHRNLSVNASDDTINQRGALAFTYAADPVAAEEAVHATVVAAAPLADALVPGLLDRYRTVLVPVAEETDFHLAATDEITPGVTFFAPCSSPLQTVSSLVHEEAHALLNAAVDVEGFPLSRLDAHVRVPWKPEPRPVSAAIHGVAAFGRVAALLARAEAEGHSEQLADRSVDIATSVREGARNLLDAGRTGFDPELVEWLEQHAETAPTALSADI